MLDFMFLWGLVGTLPQMPRIKEHPILNVCIDPDDSQTIAL